MASGSAGFQLLGGEGIYPLEGDMHSTQFRGPGVDNLVAAGYKPFMSSKPQLVSDNTVEPTPGTGHVEPPKGGPAYRIRTVRGYRRMLDWATRRMLQGLLSRDDLQAITTAAKTGAELMMTENILAAVGQDRELDNLLGDDGGFKRPRKPRGFVKRKIVVKTGVGKDGQAVDETAVTHEGDIRDDDALPKEICGIPI